MKPEIIPAILVPDQGTMIERMRLVEGLATAVQIDCMDGHFVNNRSYYQAESIDTTLGIELHLMVRDPMSVIREWRRIPQFMRAIWHVEIPVDHSSLIRECRGLGIECGLAISPETSVESVAGYLAEIDELLVLGVKPGWSGQTLIEAALKKPADAKRINPSIVTGFDGGVTQENLTSIIQAQTDRICIASTIFASSNPRETLHAILSNI